MWGRNSPRSYPRPCRRQSNGQEAGFMVRQNSLFPELESKPEGLTLPGFRSQGECNHTNGGGCACGFLAEAGTQAVRVHGHLGNRRVVSFGLRYDYSHRTVETTSDFPAFLEELRTKVAELAGRGVNEFWQAGINEYRPGAGIGWHKDKPQFGIIVGVFLLATATMRFRRAHGSGWTRMSQTEDECLCGLGNWS
jgi:alkylated DNA repair dioxygenase AlkB